MTNMYKSGGFEQTLSTSKRYNNQPKWWTCISANQFSHIDVFADENSSCTLFSFFLWLDRFVRNAPIQMQRMVEGQLRTPLGHDLSSLPPQSYFLKRCICVNTIYGKWHTSHPERNIFLRTKQIPGTCYFRCP